MEAISSFANANINFVSLALLSPSERRGGNAFRLRRLLGTSHRRDRRLIRLARMNHLSSLSTLLSWWKEPVTACTVLAYDAVCTVQGSSFFDLWGGLYSQQRTEEASTGRCLDTILEKWMVLDRFIRWITVCSLTEGYQSSARDCTSAERSRDNKHLRKRSMKADQWWSGEPSAATDAHSWSSSVEVREEKITNFFLSIYSFGRNSWDHANLTDDSETTHLIATRWWIHSSKILIRRIDWPSRRLDLNSIAHVWDVLAE